MVIGDLASRFVAFQQVALQQKVLAAALRLTDDPGATRVLTSALVANGDAAEAAASEVVRAGLDGVGQVMDVRI